jgi:hypothetical protein
MYARPRLKVDWRRRDRAAADDETKTAVENMESILDVEGINGVISTPPT